MVINNHRKHSNFALKHFMAGGCYTADAAYVLLFAQLEGLNMDLAKGQATEMRNKVKRNELMATVDKHSKAILALSEAAGETITDTESDNLLLLAQADLIEFNAGEKMFNINFEGTKREVAELTEMLEKLKPLCKFWNDDILIMEQDMCQTEWSLELAGRAENMLLANAMGIPYDHLATMRQHPEFETVILPRVMEVNKTLKITNNTGKPEILQNYLIKPKVVVEILEGLTNKQQAIDSTSN